MAIGDHDPSAGRRYGCARGGCRGSGDYAYYGQM